MNLKGGKTMKVTQKRKPSTKKNALQNSVRVNTTLATSSTIQNRAIEIINNQHPFLHSSLNPWGGNSLY